MERASVVGRKPRIAPDLASLAKDFPLPASISILLFAYAQLDVSGLVVDGWETESPVYLTGTAAFLAAGAAHYFARSHAWPWRRGVALASAAAIAIGLLGVFEVASRVSFQFLIPALLLVLVVAGFLRRSATQAALWVANLRLAVAAALASLGGIAFGAGVSAVAAALHYLFDLAISDAFYTRAWSMAMTLVSPLYGLALAPRDLAEEIDVEAPPDRQIARGVSALVHYVLVPLVLVFAVLLHVYAVTIAVAGELPRNVLGGMVTGFALGGTATWLIAWPWRERGARWLRAFVGGWFAMTVVPAILVVLAIGTRIREFGVTPDRYGVVVIVVWVAAIAVYLALRRRTADMRVILGVLALLLLVGSAGPLGAHSVSARDQMERLVELLADAGGLGPNGRLTEPPPVFDRDLEVRIVSILESLDAYRALGLLGPLFEGRAADPLAAEPGDDRSRVQIVAAAMSVRDGTDVRAYFGFRAREPLRRVLSAGSELVGPIALSARKAERVVAGPFTVQSRSDGISIRHGERDYAIAASSLVEAVPFPNGDGAPPIELSLAEDLAVLITAIDGERGSSTAIHGLTLWMLVKEDSP